MTERNFNEDELREVIRIATEKQREADNSDLRGVTLSEMKRIAGEIGISPAHIETAVDELNRQPRSTSRFADANLIVRERRTVAGHLNEENAADIASSIRERFAHVPGRVELVGSSLHWSASEEQGTSSTLSVRNQGSAVVISGSSEFRNRQVPLYLPAGIIAVFGAVALIAGGNLTIALISLLIAATIHLALRFAFHREGVRLRGAMESAVDDIEQIVASSSPDVVSAAASVKAKIELPDDDEEGATVSEQTAATHLPRTKSR